MCGAANRLEGARLADYLAVGRGALFSSTNLNELNNSFRRRICDER